MSIVGAKVLFNIFKTKRKIKQLDSSLEFEKILGKGSYGIVAKVNRNNLPYAIKLNQDYAKASFDWKHRGFDVSFQKEIGIHQELSDIEGIPDLFEVYGNDAYLMQYIDGDPMICLGSQPKAFFDKLRDIVWQMTDRNIILQEDAELNVIVDMDYNPWLTDFMLCRRVSNEYGPRYVLEYNQDLLLDLERKFLELKL